MLERQLDRGVLCVPTSSMGRLFDAVSVAARRAPAASYEAQAAIELEAMASRHLGGTAGRYRFAVGRRRARPGAGPAGDRRRPARRSTGRRCDRRRVPRRGGPGGRPGRRPSCPAPTGIDRVGADRRRLPERGAARTGPGRAGPAAACGADPPIVPPNDGGLALGQAAVAGVRLGPSVAHVPGRGRPDERSGGRRVGRAGDGRATSPAEDLAAARRWVAGPPVRRGGDHVVRGAAVAGARPPRGGRVRPPGHRRNRALPAVHVDVAGPDAPCASLARPGDVLARREPADDPAAHDLLRRAEAWGLTRLWLGAGPRPPAAPGRARAVVRESTRTRPPVGGRRPALPPAVGADPRGLRASRPARRRADGTRRGMRHLRRPGPRWPRSGPSTAPAGPRWWSTVAPSRRRQPGRPVAPGRPRARARRRGALTGCSVDDGSAVSTEPTGFLYPFIDAEERDAVGPAGRPGRVGAGQDRRERRRAGRDARPAAPQSGATPGQAMADRFRGGRPALRLRQRRQRHRRRRGGRVVPQPARRPPAARRCRWSTTGRC